MSSQYLVHYINHEKYTCFVFQSVQDASNSVVFEIHKADEFAKFKKFIQKCKAKQTPLIGYQMIDIITQIFRVVLANDQPPFQAINSIEDKYYNELPPLFINDSATVKIWNIYDISRIKNLRLMKLETLKCINNFPNVSNYVRIKENEKIDEHIEMMFQISVMKDLLFIKKLWLECIPEIKFTNALTKKYSVDFKNNPTALITKRLSLHIIASKSGIMPYDIVNKTTDVDNVEISRLLFGDYRFKHRNLLNVYQKISSSVIKNNQVEINETAEYNGIKIKFSKNGISGSIPGIYNTNKYKTVYYIDISNFFGSIVTNKNYAPHHLNKKAFISTIQDYIKIRSKEGISPIQSNFFKSAIVDLIGLSNTKSFCRDVSFYLKTTINGMFMMTKLLEMICTKTLSTKIFRIQIDGIEIEVEKAQEDALKEVLKKFQETFKLNCKVVKRKCIIVSNALNYTALSMPKKVGEDYTLLPTDLVKEINNEKYVFQIESKGIYRDENDSLENGSYRIIPKLLKDYYFKGILPEDAIKTYKNIFDYIGFVNCKTHYDFEYNDKVVYETTIRYYKIKSDAEGATKIKRKNNHKSFINIEKDGTECIASIINENTPIDMYDIDYDFYIKKVKQEISKLTKNAF